MGGDRRQSRRWDGALTTGCEELCEVVRARLEDEGAH